MTRNSLSLFLFYSLAFIFIIALLSFTAANNSASPGGYSGSPLDGQNCDKCHIGSTITQKGLISSNVDSGGYVPGQTYTISATLSGIGYKGFEVSPLTASNLPAGTLLPGNGTKLVNAGKGITHNPAKDSNLASWTFQWTAPPTGSGKVTFYGAFVRSISTVYLSILEIPEYGTNCILNNNQTDILLSGNPVSDYIQLEFNQLKEIHTVTLYSINGTALTHPLIISPSGISGKIIIPLPISIKEGICFLEIHSATERKTFKLVVLRQ